MAARPRARVFFRYLVASLLLRALQLELSVVYSSHPQLQNRWHGRWGGITGSGAVACSCPQCQFEAESFLFHTADLCLDRLVPRTMVWSEVVLEEVITIPHG